MSLRARGSWVVALCIAWTCVLGTARADDPPSGPPPEAKKAFADGKAAFERGEYEVALQLFQRAALIAPAPSLYYNIGMAYERLGRYEDSAIAFEKYLQLADAPQSDDERNFQANLKSRAHANRSRARRAPEPSNTPPQPLVEPPPGPPPAPGTPPRTAYAPQPYGYPRTVFTAPPLTHQQKLDKAAHHRNNGIALTVVGGVFTVTGFGLMAWTIVMPNVWDENESLFRGLSIWGTTIPTVVGVSLLIPGAVAWAKWQGELSKELKRPDDGAAARKAALDLAVPPVVTSNGPRVVFSTPVVRF